jgi:hypothetical protein
LEESKEINLERIHGWEKQEKRDNERKWKERGIGLDEKLVWIMQQ